MYRSFWYQMARIVTIGTFVTPIILSLNSFVFPFIVLKVFVFRSLVIVLAGIYVYLWYSDRKRFQPYMSAIHWAILAFWIVFLITSITAVDVKRAFWDNHERMLGLVTVSHVVLYSFLVSWIFRTKEEIIVLWRYFLLAGAVVMLTGMRQKYGSTPFLLSSGGRVAGTLGNPIYFSAYGLFLFFSGVLCTYWNRKNRIWAGVCALAGLLGFLGIFWGGTRGTILGLIAGVGVAITIFGIFNESKQYRKYSYGLLLLGVCCLGLVFLFRQTSFVQSIPGIGRLVNTSLTFDTSDTRLMAWEIGIEAWLDKPFLGWGPNGFFFAFNQFYNPRFLVYGYGETWFDNAHNVVVNTLTTGGVFGIVVYLSLFVTVLYALWYIYKKDRRELLVVSCFTGFMVGHFVNNLFVFESPTSYIYFFFFLAAVSVWFCQTNEIKNVISTQLNVPSISLQLSVGIVVFLFILIININPARANMGSLRVMALFNQGKIVQAYDEYKRVILIPTPHKDDIRSDIARSVVTVFEKPSLRSDISSDLLRQITIEMFTNIQKNIIDYPNDIRHKLMFLQMTQSLLPFDSSPEIILKQSQVYVDQALALSPKRQQLFFNKGTLLAQLGDVDGATKIYRSAIDLDPTVSESWRQYIRLLQASKQSDLLKSTLDEIRVNRVLNEEEIKKIEDSITETVTP